MAKHVNFTAAYYYFYFYFVSKIKAFSVAVKLPAA